MYYIMPNYSETIIYKIVCKDESITDCYVGHTTNLKKRKIQHKESCTNKTSKQYNNDLYTFIRANGGLDNWNINILETCNCENIFQARERERYWIKTLEAKLNNRMPNRDNKEYYEENKEIILEKCKIYREENKEHFAETNKLWVEANKEHVDTYKHLWYEENKERILEQKKQYHQEHKEQICEKHRQYHQDHIEEIHAKKAEYYIENKDHIIEKSAKYYEDNKADKLAYQKAYALANKEKIKEYKRAYNQRKKLEKQQEQNGK